MEHLNHVAIVGGAPTASHAPYFDEGVEIWGLSWVKYPREDLSFDIHEDGTVAVDLDRPLPDYGNEKEIPVMAIDSYRYDKGHEYPLQEVQENVTRYLESSVAYMLAYAFLKEIPEVSLYGVHMARRTEYFWQLPNLEYLLGYGKAKGIKVNIAPGAPIMMSSWTQGRYGARNNEKRF